MKIINKKAKFNYVLFEGVEAGISLTGIEVKTIKNRGIDLSNSYVKILNSEVFLINANVPISDDKNFVSTRTRKLLLKRHEIVSLETKIKQKKLTLLATKVYTKGRLIKLEIALAKAKRQFEKKEILKKKDQEREVAQELRGKD